MCVFSCDFSFLTYNVYICYRRAQKKLYTKTDLPIDDSTLETDTWFRHPTKPIEVNEDGTHVRNIENHEFLQIRCYQWKTCKWLETKVNIFGVDKIFGRLALECFLGRELFSKETCEHIDCDRTNNSKSNLVPRHRLFQSNARRCHKFQVDGRVTGVTEVQNGRAFRACVRIYTPDDRSASIRLTKHFWVRRYSSKDEAFNAAVDFRRKYTLQAGMVWV